MVWYLPARPASRRRSRRANTPNWSGADLQGVPANAAAVLSLRIGDAPETAAEALALPLRRWTGLDLGRELFSNIDQLALSIVPPKDAQAFDKPAVRMSEGIDEVVAGDAKPH